MIPLSGTKIIAMGSHGVKLYRWSKLRGHAGHYPGRLLDPVDLQRYSYFHKSWVSSPEPSIRIGQMCIPISSED